MARLVYWLCSKISEEHRQKASALQERGFTPVLFSDLEMLQAAFSEKRISILIVSDVGNPEHVKKNIDLLMNSAEFKGVRFILSIEANYQDIKRLAVLSCFRDMIPLHESDARWVERLMFASGSHAARFQMPAGMISLSEACQINVPARIIGMSEKSIQLETPLKPNPGASIALKGSLTDELACERLLIKVVRRSNSRLNYRFSDSIHATWEAPGISVASAKLFIDSMNNQEGAFRPRIFVVIKSSSMRNDLIKQLESENFCISTALHKANVEHDPKYFSPDIVVIEDCLCGNDKNDYLSPLLENTSHEVPILVIGSQSEAATAGMQFPDRVIAKHLDFDQNVIGHINTLLARQIGLTRKRREDESFVNFDSKDKATMNFLSFPGQLRSIHPTALTVSYGFQINNYALFQISSPHFKSAVNKQPFIKVVDVTEGKDPAFETLSFSARGIITDLSPKDRSMMCEASHSLLSTLIGEFQQKVSGASGTERELASDQKSGAQKSGGAPAPAAQNKSAARSPGSEDAASSASPSKPGGNAKPLNAAPYAQSQVRRRPTPEASPLSRLMQRAHDSSGQNAGSSDSASASSSSTTTYSTKKTTSPKARREMRRYIAIFALAAGILAGILFALSMVIEPNTQASKKFSDPFIKMQKDHPSSFGR